MTSVTTYLFVPGDRPERFAKALASGADRVILDLEDAVRPEAKPAARRAILAAQLDWSRVLVRLNDAASRFFDDDLAILGQMQAPSILLPKAEPGDGIDRVCQAAGRSVQILPQIETVRGLDSVGAMLARPDVPRAVFGHLDFALDLGCSPDWEPLLLARSSLVLRSRLAGAEPPVESVTPDFRDPDAVRLQAMAARRLGFGGKLLIHPAQVAPVAEAFAPSRAELDWARRVISAVESGGNGALTVDGKMIDKPVEAAARRILSFAHAGSAAGRGVSGGDAIS